VERMADVVDVLRSCTVSRQSKVLLKKSVSHG
jgi:hypothetical protein